MALEEACGECRKRFSSHPDDTGCPYCKITHLTARVREQRDLLAEYYDLLNGDDTNFAMWIEERKRADRLAVELSEAKHRSRRAAQILIEEIGAPGPENVDETAVRAVAEITHLTAENALVKKALRLAAGELSTYGDYTTKPPYEVYDNLLASAAIDAGEGE
jgi:hypothetical protein